MADVFGLINQDKIKFGNGLGWFILAIEAGGEIGARRPEIRGQFKRSAQQVFGVLITPDAAREFGHHADRGDVEWVCFQMRAEQRFGIRQAVIVKRECSFYQLRVVDPALD